MIRDGAKLLWWQFIPVSKDEYPEQEIWKVRFVLQGYSGKNKSTFVHDAASSKQYSVIFVVFLTAILESNCFNRFNADIF